MDFSALTDPDLEEILVAYGFDDIRSYSRADKEAILRNIQGNDAEITSSTADSSQAQADMKDDTAEVYPAEDVTMTDEDILNTAMINENAAYSTPDAMNVNIPLFDGDETEQALPEAPVLVREDSSGPPLTEEQEAQVLSLMEVTGCDPAYARSVLLSTEWDSDSAVGIFFASEGGFQNAQRNVPAPGVTSRPAPSATHFYSSTMGGGGMHISGTGFLGRGSEEDGMMDAESAMRQHMRSMQEVMQMAQSHHRMMDDGDEDEGDDDVGLAGVMQYFRQHGVFPAGMGMPSSSSSGAAHRRHQEVDEDGVRINVDPIRMQRLISRQITDDENTHAMLGRADDPNVQWLVEPPRHLTYMGSLTHAKNKATLENRWLLVNIQSHEQFASNELNRDTWVDETIVSILNNQYLFWQRGHTTPDAQEFMRLYRINEEQLPIIAIIEPNTGAQLSMHKGYMEPIDMAAYLIEFNEKHQRIPTPMKPSTPKVDGEVRKAESTSDQQQDEKEILERVMDNIAAADVSSQQGGNAAKFDPFVEYGSPAPEPADNDPDAIKIAIRLASGKRVNRRYRRQDRVRTLFAVVVQEDPASAAQPFDLTIVAAGASPSVSLVNSLDSSLEESQLKGTMVIYKKLV